ncbi:PhoU domain-containing protein [Staphylococcus saprophyticus]|nr:PhoU domain-containing protein [Staphylococcus saprophyticus]
MSQTQKVVMDSKKQEMQDKVKSGEIPPEQAKQMQSQMAKSGASQDIKVKRAEFKTITNKGANMQASQISSNVLNGIGDNLNKQITQQSLDTLEKQDVKVSANEIEGLTNPVKVADKQVHKVKDHQGNGNASFLMFMPVWISSIVASILLFFAFRTSDNIKISHRLIASLGQLGVGVLTAFIGGFGYVYFMSAVQGFDFPDINKIAVFVSIALLGFIGLILGVMTWLGMKSIPIFLIILPLYQMAIEWMQSLLNLKPEMVIAFAHGTFNVTNTLIQLPFIFVLAWVVTKIVSGEDLNEKYKPRNLDRNLINRAPSIALQEAQEEIQNIGHMTFSMLKNVNEYDDKKERDIMHKHAAIDNMNDNVRQYLTKISEKKLSKKDAERMTVLQDVNRTILKVAGLSEAYLLDMKKEQTNQVQISEKAEASINRLYDHVTTSFDKTIDMFDVYDRVKRDEIVKISNESYRLEHDLRKKHIKRLSSGECTPEGGLLYLDMIGILERIGYHSRNISESMIDIDEIETNEETEHALEWSH